MKINKQLFRDSDNGRIAGVCAGIANYFGLERWLVRILAVTAFFLLAGPFMFVAYLACWFILEKKPANYQDPTIAVDPHQAAGKGWRNSAGRHSSSADGETVAVKTKVWQAGEPPAAVLSNIARRFNDSEQRLRKMEKYVTSREYQLSREIDKL